MHSVFTFTPFPEATAHARDSAASSIQGVLGRLPMPRFHSCSTHLLQHVSSFLGACSRLPAEKIGAWARRPGFLKCSLSENENSPALLASWHLGIRVSAATSTDWHFQSFSCFYFSTESHLSLPPRPCCFLK